MLDIILGCIFIIHEELIMIFIGFCLAVNELFTVPIKSLTNTFSLTVTVLGHEERLLVPSFRPEDGKYN